MMKKEQPPPAFRASKRKAFSTATLCSILTAFILSIAWSAPGTAATDPRYLAEGKASWYGPDLDGKRTANGEHFDQAALTAAHPDLPFGTLLRVTNVRNGRTVVVRVNDRGPFVGARIIDLSKGAAKALGMLNRGTTHVKLESIASR